jgi:hypothetical protein
VAQLSTLDGMSDTPHIQAPSEVIGCRYFALLLSVLSAYFAFDAGNAHGSWFYYFVSYVVISQFFTICSIGLLAFIRSRIGWLAMTGFTFLIQSMS